MKRDIKTRLTVPEYYRKLGDEILTLDTAGTKDWSKEYREYLREQHYEYARKMELEEEESLKIYKRNSYKKSKK